MGMVMTEITLKNTTDVGDVQRGYVREDEIRTATVQAIVDTGAITLVINEDLCQKLGLQTKGDREVKLADGKAKIAKIAEPVEVHWKNRDMVCRPLVISQSGNILLGAVPLEDMDLMVDPVQQQLIGRHGDEAVSIVC